MYRYLLDSSRVTLSGLGGRKFKTVKAASRVRIAAFSFAMSGGLADAVEKHREVVNVILRVPTPKRRSETFNAVGVAWIKVWIGCVRQVTTFRCNFGGGPEGMDQSCQPDFVHHLHKLRNVLLRLDQTDCVLVVMLMV